MSHSRHHSLSFLHMVNKLPTRDVFDASVNVIQDRIDGSNIDIVQIDDVIYAAKHIPTPSLMEQKEVLEEWQLVRDLKLLGYHHLFNDTHNESMIIIQDYSPCNLLQYICNQRQFQLNKHKPKQNKRSRKLISKSSSSPFPSYPHLTEQESQHIALSILLQLKKMHKFGVAHCDIKPQSIIKLTTLNNNKYNYDDWRVHDFSLLTRFNPNKGYSMNTWRGTIAWSAPELIPNNGRNNRCGPEIDVWGMGLIILYMMTGENPFELTVEECKDNKLYTLEDGKKYWYYTKLLGYNRKNKWNKHLTLLRKQNRISSDLFDLLIKYMLVFDVRKRCNVKTVLKHKWFRNVVKIKNINTQKRFIIGK